jgi:hypothetical protein
LEDENILTFGSTQNGGGPVLLSSTEIPRWPATYGNVLIGEGAGSLFLLLYLFIVHVTTLSSSDYIALNDGKETPVAYFEILSQHLPQGTEERHKKSQDSSSPKFEPRIS